MFTLSQSDLLRSLRFSAVICAGTISICTSNAAAQRKGFVLNLGLGPALTSFQATSSGFKGERETRTAFGSDFKIGYAPSDQLLIYYSNDAAFFGADAADAVFTVSGMSGLGATYFFSPAAPSLYVQGALGVAAFNVIYEDTGIERMGGRGLNLGAGFEFARHWIIDFDLIATSVDPDFGGKLSVRTARVAINWLLY